MNRVVSVFIVCCLFLIPTGHAFAQAKEKIDDLEILLANHPEQDAERVDILNQIGFEYWTVDPAKSEEYGLEAQKLSEQLGYKQGEGMAHRVIGVSYWSRGDFLKSLRHLFSGKELYKEVGDTLGEANCVMNIGLVYADEKDFGRALENFQYAIQLFEKLERRDRIGITYNKVGSVYLEKGDLIKSKDYLEKALVIHQEEEFSFGVMEASNRLGLLYRELGDLKKAGEYLQTSLSIARTNMDHEHLAKNLENLASVAIQESDFSLAKQYLDEAYPIAKQYHYRKWLRDIYKDYRDIYAARKEFGQALDYYQKFESIKDSIFSEERVAQIANMELEYQQTQQAQALKLREQEIELLQQRARANRLLTILMASGFVLLAIGGYVFYRNQRDKEKRRRKSLEHERALLDSELTIAKSLEQELRESLEFRNRELTSYTVNFIRKNDLIEKLKEKMDRLKVSMPDHQDELKSINQLIQQSSTIDKDWEDFKRTFENVHRSFFPRLLQYCPDLTQSELRLCALVSLNLSIKEMASLMGISPDSVKTARYRLRKKLNLEQDQNLGDFVMGFS